MHEPESETKRRDDEEAGDDENGSCLVPTLQCPLIYPRLDALCQQSRTTNTLYLGSMLSHAGRAV